MPANILVFGATGYTGHLVVEALVRNSMRPVLVGRDAKRLQEMSIKHNGLPFEVASVDDINTLKAILNPGDILVSTVGPFSRYGKVALDAVVEKQCHYLDCSGEPGFFRQVIEMYHEAARSNSTAMLTGFGFDFVPGHCAAGLALEGLAGSDESLYLSIGYFLTGKTDLMMSEGTLDSLITASIDEGLFWQRGRYLKGYGGSSRDEFIVNGKARTGISISSTEHLFLPRQYNLRQIDVYAGWFGLLTPVIHQIAKVQAQLLKLPGYRAALRLLVPTLLSSKGSGPNKSERDKTGSQVIAKVQDSKGNLVSSCVLVGVDPYTFTAEILAWGAQQIFEGRVTGVGALGPVEAFGLELLTKGCLKAGLVMDRDNVIKLVGSGN